VTAPHTDDRTRLEEALAPVQDVDDEPLERPRSGVGLCLSGGGYRAMVFHIGVLWRLNELGWLPRLTRLSSVSGGSITSGLLALRWSALKFDATGVSARYADEIADPLQKLASRTIDVGAIIRGVILPGSVSSRIEGAYKRHLYGDATLQSLPSSPMFVINATNVQSGVLWRFMRYAMRDYRVGEVPKPEVSLAFAVAASSAFPPVLSPSILRLSPKAYARPTTEDLHHEPFTTEVVLTDGGVYDNLGLETVWKTCEMVLVSDAGGKMQASARPKRDWVRHLIRVTDMIDNQVRSLRKRQLIGSYVAGERRGTYWGIRTDIRNYELSDMLPCPLERTMALANVKTRLKALSRTTQERLINWGYAVTDAAMRRHVDPTLPAAKDFPYPAARV
jgi:NTE family protein